MCECNQVFARPSPPAYYFAFDVADVPTILLNPRVLCNSCQDCGARIEGNRVLPAAAADALCAAEQSCSTAGDSRRSTLTRRSSGQRARRTFGARSLNDASFSCRRLLLPLCLSKPEHRLSRPGRQAHMNAAASEVILFVTALRAGPPWTSDQGAARRRRAQTAIKGVADRSVFVGADFTWQILLFASLIEALSNRGSERRLHWRSAAFWIGTRRRRQALCPA